MQITRHDRVRMERAHVLAWPALRAESVNGWLWRSSGGGSQRANSVSTIDFDGADPSAAITEVEARYRAVGAPARFQTFDDTNPSGMADLLQHLGYDLADPTITMFKPVTGIRSSGDGEARQVERPGGGACGSITLDIEEQDNPWAAWRTLYLAEIAENRRQTNTLIIDQIPAPRRFFACRRDGRLVSTALCVIGYKCAVIECVATRAACRRQGAARVLLAALQHWAVRQDVDWIGLQVAASNAPAVRLYEHLGFMPGATNRFWIAPSDRC